MATFRQMMLAVTLLTVSAASASSRRHGGRTDPQLWWSDVLDLGVGGRPFPSNSGNLTFARFPEAAQPDLSPGEWTESLASSGVFVQFATNASSVHLSYELRDANQTRFAAFPPIGYSGMDLYRWDNGSSTWRWVASTFEGLQAAGESGSTAVLESPLFTDTAGWPIGPLPPFDTLNATYRYRLHLPSYNGVMSASIGVPVGASLLPDLSWNASGRAPVVYLGTSIAQGAYTARPGTTFVNRLSRNISVSAVNMGLAGSCRLELGLAKWVAAIPASVLVVDCGWNMSPQLVAANTAPFVRAVRAAERARQSCCDEDLPGGSGDNEDARRLRAVGASAIPASSVLSSRATRGCAASASASPIPIVLVEPTDFRPAWLLGDIFNVSGVRAELRAAFAQLVAGGDNALTYVPASALYPGQVGPTEELTYAGVHPMDRGQALLAQALAGVLQPLVGSSGDAKLSTASAGGCFVPGQPLARESDSCRQGTPPNANDGALRRETSRDGIFGFRDGSEQLQESQHDAPDASAGLTDASPHGYAPGYLIHWTSAEDLTIRGRAFNDTPSPWNRLPSAAHGVVRSAVWALSLQSAGITVSFESDSPVVWVNYTARDAFSPDPHFAVSGTLQFRNRVLVR